MIPRRFALSVALTAMAMVLPLVLFSLLGRYPVASDPYFYATSLRLFSHQFWSGELYPRWLDKANAGFGSPVFLFFSPLTFYAGSLFEWLSPADTDGFLRLFLCMMLGLSAAGFGAWLWLKFHLEESKAQRGALIYMALLYLLLFVHVIYAMPQLWGVALSPFLLHAADRLIHHGPRAVPWLAMGYALLALTHLLSLVVFAVVPIAYAVAFSKMRFKAMALSIMAAALGLGVAAIYLVPAVINKLYIDSDFILTGRLRYADHFFDWRSCMALLILIVPQLLLFLSLPVKRLSPPMRFWLFITAALIVMASPLSKPLWDALPPLQYLQFPYRFLLAAIPAASFMTAQWLTEAKNRRVYMIALLACFALAAFTNPNPVLNQFYDSREPVAATLDHSLIPIPEYRTRPMVENNIDFSQSVPKAYTDMPPAMLISGKGAISVTHMGPREIRLHAAIDSGQATAVLHRFDYPGWQVSLQNVSLMPPQKVLLTLRLPHGSYDIILTQPWFPGEKAGALISLAALGLWLLWLIAARMRLDR